MIALPWNTHVNLTSLRGFKPRGDITQQHFAPTDVNGKGKDSAVVGSRKGDALYSDLLPTLPGILVEKEGGEDVKACAFMERGNVLVAVGGREGIWIWRDRPTELEP